MNSVFKLKTNNEMWYWIAFGVILWGASTLIYMTIPEFDIAYLFLSSRTFAFVSFSLLSLIIWIGGLFKLSEVPRFAGYINIISRIPNNFRAILAVFSIALPTWIFLFSHPIFYPPFGLIIRIPIFFATVMISIFIISPIFSRAKWIKYFLLFTLGATAIFILGMVFNQVIDFPFSIGWSEGNRIWDISLMFGSDRYIFPSGEKISSYTNRGRQFVSGIPFLFPGLNILGYRFWDALIKILPGFLLGATLVMPNKKKVGIKGALVFMIWSMIYVFQGPIYAVIIFVMIATIYAVKVKNILNSGLLIMLISIFATISRFTWGYAPGIWAGLIALLDIKNNPSPSQNRNKLVRPILLGFAGLVGSQFSRTLSLNKILLMIGILWILSMFLRYLLMKFLQDLGAQVWFRFAGKTALLLTFLLVGLFLNIKEQNDFLVVLVALIALITIFISWVLFVFLGGAKINYRFTIIGLVLAGISGISIGIFVPDIGKSMATFLNIGNFAPATKILEYTLNQDLLWDRLLPNSTFSPGILIGLAWILIPTALLLWAYKIKIIELNKLKLFGILFAIISFGAVGITASVKIGGGGDLHNTDMLILTLLLLFAPIYPEIWRRLNNNVFKSDISIPLLFALITMPAIYILNQGGPLIIPKDDLVNSTLAKIQAEISLANKTGEILFIDQRQLLTFRYIEGVTLHDEYEKKKLIDLAFSQREDYFNEFYTALANHDYTLIINEISSTNRNNRDFSPFSAENDVWVSWVSDYLLLYYEPIFMSRELNIELLVPRQ